MAIRAGFVGGGFMGAVHTRAARAARAELVAIASSSPERAEQAAAELGVREGAASLDAVVVASDVVHVCTPNDQHAAQALATIAAGRHVICEKPLATTAADARRTLRNRSSAWG